MNKIILCADDYGIAPGINKAIEDLAQKKRISAVSCMMSSVHFPADVSVLKKCRPALAIGLHLTLTYLPSLSGFPTMTEMDLLKLTWTRRINRAALTKEITAQFERFIAVFGFPPDYIDGHQHIHVLPVVRDILLTCRERYAPDAWIRNVSHPFGGNERKRKIVSIMGWRFLQQLRRKKIVHNPALYGFYDYTTPQDFAALFTTWLQNAPDNALIYVHPGIPDKELAKVDTVLAPRQKEYDFFNSEAFTTMPLDLVTHPKATA